MSCKPWLASLVVGLMFAPATHAQFLVNGSRILPSTPHIQAANGPIEVSSNGDGDQWAAEEPDSSEVFAGAAPTIGTGCVRLGQPGRIQRPDDGAPLPDQIVVESREPGGTYVYNGLFIDGTQWVTSPSFSQPATIEFTVPYAVLRDPDTGDLLLFSPCEKAWTRLAIGRRSASRMQSGSSAVVVERGDELWGVSLRDPNPVVLSGLTRPTYIPGTGSAERSLLSYQTGGSELSIFTAYPRTWTRVSLVDPTGTAGIVLHEYGKDTLLVADGDNRAVFVSAFTGVATSAPISGLRGIVARGDFCVGDSVAAVADVATGNGWVYRAIDDQVFTASQVSRPPSTVACPPRTSGTVLCDDDWAGFWRGSRIELISGTARGTTWATLDLSGEPVLCTAQNSTNFVVVTPLQAHFYSSIHHRWTSVSYAGVFRSIQSEAFVAYVRTSAELIAYSPRTRQTDRATISGPIEVRSDDGIVFVRQSSSVRVFGADSTAFKFVRIAPNAPVIQVKSDYVVVVEDSATGGSRLSLFSRAADAWFQNEAVERFVPGSETFFAARHALVRLGSDLARFTAYPDVNSCRTWPSTLAPAFRAVAGSGAARMIVEGPPNANIVQIVGQRRAAPVTVPGVIGPLQIRICDSPLCDAPTLFLPLGVLNASGVLCYDLELPRGLSGDLYFQNLLFSGGETGLGQLSSLLIQ